MQEDKAPKVSVCITTYNHEKFIRETIDSVLAQETNFDYELVISDDASTDKTPEILKGYKQAYPDKIHLILNRINIGAIKNFNQALKGCKGEYIAILDGDDRMLPGKLQKQVDALDSHSMCVMCAHDTRVFNSDTNKTIRLYKTSKKKDIFNLADLLNVLSLFAFSSLMFRRIAAPPQGIDENIKQIGDIYLNVYLARQGNIIYLHEVLGEYRVHLDSLMYKAKGKSYFNDMAITLNMARTNLSDDLKGKLNKWEAYAYLYKGIEELENGEKNLARKDILFSLKKKIYTKGQFFYLLLSFMPRTLLAFLKK